MTNGEVFEKIFGMSVDRLKNISDEALEIWKIETNKLLWGGFNNANYGDVFACLSGVRKAVEKLEDKKERKIIKQKSTQKS